MLRNAKGMLREWKSGKSGKFGKSGKSGKSRKARKARRRLISSVVTLLLECGSSKLEASRTKKGFTTEKNFHTRKKEFI